MQYFVSHDMEGTSLDSASRFIRHSRLAARVFPTLFLLGVALVWSSYAQVSVPTSRGDNARTGANTSETLLTPANVNQNSFGHLFSAPVDYIVMAQPLFVSNVNIPGQGIHNVVYVVTQADSVYAIDADTGAQLWHASMLNGGVTASGAFLPCGTAPGFSQEGIVGTPAIDTATNTMYLVAKTLLGTTVRHHIHALDISTGSERPGSPVLITAQSISKKGHVTIFNSLHQKNRPGLLLLNGVLYMGFGSNYCNDSNTGWVLAYDASSLAQLAAFNTSPDHGLTSIWQTGNGLPADEAGNIFVETAEAGVNQYDVPTGGQTYCNSVIKLFPDLSVADFFTPWSVAFLNANDLDLSSAGALVLPDQVGPFPHELVASGKQGIVYVLNRDNMGMFSANDSQVVQEFALLPNPNSIDVLMSSPAYWNNTVYFTPNGSPVLAFPLSGGLLQTPPRKTAASYAGGGHSAAISANGNTNGIVWDITGQLLAFDAVSLKLLYTSNQAPNGRDKLPALGHFATQTVANGRVYVGTKNSLEAYGLFHAIKITGGNAQTATVNTALPTPIQIHVANPYNGQPDVGVTVNFSDGCTLLGATTCGSFNPASAITDSSGNASTTYTVPKKSGTYTLTFSGTGFAKATTTATAKPDPAIKIIALSGGAQTGAAGSILAKPLVAQARDVYSNGVPGVTITFTANQGAVPSPSSAITDAKGLAPTSLRLPTTVSTITVTAASAGLKNATFSEFSVAGPAASIVATSGGNQSAPAGTQLPNALTAVVADQYGNPVPSVGVTFDDGGAGGTFSNANPVVTGSNGAASQFYTLPPTRGTITIHATVAGVTSPAVFTETSQ